MPRNKCSARRARSHLGVNHPVRWLGVFQPEVVIDRVAEFLLAAKVALSCLHRRMPQQKLNLLKLASRQMAQSRAGPAQVMGRKVRDAGSLSHRPHHMPDRLGCDSIAPNLTHATYSSENDTI